MVTAWHVYCRDWLHLESLSSLPAPFWHTRPQLICEIGSGSIWSSGNRSPAGFHSCLRVMGSQNKVAPPPIPGIWMFRAWYTHCPPPYCLSSTFYPRMRPWLPQNVTGCSKELNQKTDFLFILNAEMLYFWNLCFFSSFFRPVMVTSPKLSAFSLRKELKSPVRTLLLQNHLKARGTRPAKKH